MNITSHNFNLTELFYLHSSFICRALLFADDTTLQLKSTNLPKLYLKANYNLKLAEEWFNTNFLILHLLK